MMSTYEYTAQTEFFSNQYGHLHHHLRMAFIQENQIKAKKNRTKAKDKRKKKIITKVSKKINSGKVISYNEKLEGYISSEKFENMEYVQQDVFGKSVYKSS